MSQPFSNNPASPPAAGSFAQDPFAPPPKKSRWWVWLLGGCGCSTVLLVLCCGVVGWLGLSKGIPALLRPEVADNADVQEHIGEITSLTTNITDSSSEKNARGGDINVMVVDAVGTKGSGKFIAEMPPGGKGGSPFGKIELRMEDGKTFEIK